MVKGSDYHGKIKVKLNMNSLFVETVFVEMSLSEFALLTCLITNPGTLENSKMRLKYRINYLSTTPTMHIETIPRLLYQIQSITYLIIDIVLPDTVLPDTLLLSDTLPR